MEKTQSENTQLENNDNNLIRVKGSDRIQINNILAAASVAIFTLLIGLSDVKLNKWMIIQLAVSTPMLITSSLAYAKLQYRDEKELPLWDGLGWITLSLGYIMLLNSMMILLYSKGYSVTSWWFMGITVTFFAIYSILDIIANKKRMLEKGWKLAFYLILLFLGAVLPILSKWG